MSVKNLMALGKWLLLGSSLLLTACGTTNLEKTKSLSSQKSVSHNYTHAGTGVEVWYNFVRNNLGKLSKEDRAKQDKAVFFALYWAFKYSKIMILSFRVNINFEVYFFESVSRH